MSKPGRETAGGVVGKTLSLNVLFDILSNQYRRYVLYYLYVETDGVGTVSDIVSYIQLHRHEKTAKREDDVDLEIALHHVHLPKLEHTGVIEYDRRTSTVRYWPQPSLEEWLEHAYYKEVER